MARCMNPPCLNNKITNNENSSRRDESNFGSTSTTLSSTRSFNPSSGSPSPPLTLSASFLNSQFGNKSPDGSNTGGDLHESGAEGVLTVSPRGLSLRDPTSASRGFMLHGQTPILPIPRPRSLLAEEKYFIQHKGTRSPPAIRPRPSLREVRGTSLCSSSQMHSKNIADMQV